MDELGSEDRALVDEAIAARSPSAADRARVKERLIAAGVLGGAAGVATGVAQASSALSVSKVVSILALVGATSGAVVWLASSETPRASAPPVASAEPTENDETSNEATPSGEAANDGTATDATANEETVEPTVAPETTDEAAETVNESAGTAPRRRSSPPGSLADDVALLHRAQAERARDPAHALELALEHRRSFPRSPLAEERRALRVLLLCDLGRRAAAVRLGERFLARTEDSPLRRSIEESCVRR